MRAWIVEVIIAISQALGLERPVFMGCSIGGLLAPVLAYERPNDVRAVIGVNSGMSERPDPPQHLDTSDSAGGLQPGLYFHPRVGNDWKAAAMMGLMAPGSPEAFQRETAWLYASEGPPVYYGDIWSYRTQFRLTEAQACSIDTSRTSVYLLTGEYDPFALDGAADRLAGYIEGSHHAVIPNAGHFAPSDNPEAFKEALSPVLREIASAEQRSLRLDGT
jgi:pimeloyl-ACP methyl ester carboxylesterase